MNELTARALRGPCLGLVMAALPVVALAHHSTLPFDGEHATALRGTVREFAWRNPHSYIYLDVKTAAGEIEHWTIETEALIFLRRLGWSRDMMKPGEAVSVIGARAKNGSNNMRCKTLTLANGRQFACFPNSS